MIINRITLNNFGSYEGLNTIDTKVNNTKNIVLFGGKNGAGKTTLFKSIGLCLYGYTSLGFSNQSSKYVNLIKNLINNKAKVSKPSNMSVEIELSLENDQGIDIYVLKRNWILDKELKEDFCVIKNDMELSAQETADFEKYLLSIIPPEMFNLYFFDGEKITDFFTDQEGNRRLKNSFLTLCGYDTFDIMSKNFKRCSSNKNNSPEYEQYVSLKTINTNLLDDIHDMEARLKSIVETIKNCDAEMAIIDKSFTTSGGITDEEWKKKEDQLKQEERNREEWNYSLKKLANDVIPFLIVKKQIKEVKKQILEENKNRKIDNFKDILNSKAFENYFSNKRNEYDELIEIANNEFDNKINKVLDLSLEQESQSIAEANKILDFDEKIVYELKNNIKNSISKSSTIRKQMEKLSASSSSEYIKRKNSLLEEKTIALTEQVKYDQLLNELTIKYQENSLELSKSQNILENAIKQESINDISIKASLMLDKLQNILYKEQISKLENNIKKNAKVLMTKDSLICDVTIDDNFGIHIYQNENISIKNMINYLNSDEHERDISRNYINELNSKADEKNKSTIEYLNSLRKEEVLVPMEISISSLSAGEKQMFIMSLYLSLVQLKDARIPFVIDTPFARIDKDHRINISKYFFSMLKGQVFILSTNKELDKEHTKIIGKKVSKVYTLINKDNSRTDILENKYFQE